MKSGSNAFKQYNWILTYFYLLQRLLENMAQAEDEFMHPEKQLGCDPVKYLEDIKTDIKEFVLPIATFVDNTAIGTGVTKVVGGGLGIIGGGITAGGIIAAPFTLGVSLILTFTGLGISIGGTLAASGATVTKLVLDKKKKRQSKEALDKLCKKLNTFVDIIRKYDEAFQAGYKYFSTETGKRRLKDWIKTGFEYAKIGATPASVGMNVGKIVGVAVTAVRLWEAVEVSAVQISIEAIWSEVAIGGRVLVTAGSKLAIIVASAGAVLSVGFGIWDCVSGAKDIKMALKSKEESANKQSDVTGFDKGEKANGEDVKLIVENENKTLSEEEKAKLIKEQVKNIAEEIRQKAREMEEHIDTILNAYLEKRSDIEEQIKNIQNDHKGFYFGQSMNDPPQLCIENA